MNLKLREVACPRTHAELSQVYCLVLMQNAGLDEHKLESRLWGEISITSDMQMTPPLWQKGKKN